jgi:hypothetical protein
MTRNSTTFMTAAIVAAALILAMVAPAHAQDTDKQTSSPLPEQQFGFGASNEGFHIHYAFEPRLHIGLNLNLDLDSYDSLGVTYSRTNYEFGPYLKYLVRADIVQPYLYASFSIIRAGSGAASIIKGSGRLTAEGRVPDVEMRVKIAFGGEHFFSRNVGIYSQVNLIDAFVSDPASFHIGLAGAAVGGEFFF